MVTTVVYPLKYTPLLQRDKSFFLKNKRKEIGIFKKKYPKIKEEV